MLVPKLMFYLVWEERTFYLINSFGSVIIKNFTTIIKLIFMFLQGLLCLMLCLRTQEEAKGKMWDFYLSFFLSIFWCFFSHYLEDNKISMHLNHHHHQPPLATPFLGYKCTKFQFSFGSSFCSFLPNQWKTASPIKHKTAIGKDVFQFLFKP